MQQEKKWRKVGLLEVTKQILGGTSGGAAAGVYDLRGRQR
jgi:hypothetical protein